MPFNELQRRDSWPPTILRIRNDEPAEETSAIDENPFSFFLTSPEELDIDEDDLEDLSAGIETSTSKAPAVREISPSAIQRSRLPLGPDEDDEEVEYAFTTPLSLKEFTFRYTNGRKSRQEQRTENKLAGLGIAIPEFTAGRGRAKVRFTPSRGERGRGQTRSLIMRRPHSWRVPSPDIESIKEERESDDSEEKVKEEPKQELSQSAPPSPEAVKKEIMKPKKRVHWAF